jgi:hypothetical protein
MAVRFGNVIGSSGSFVPLFRKQIERRLCPSIRCPTMKAWYEDGYAECGGQGSCGGKNRDSASIFLLIFLLDISLNYYL